MPELVQQLKEVARIRSAQYYQDNAEKVKARVLRHYKNNAKVIKASMKRYGQKNSERNAKRKQERRQENPAKYMLTMKKHNSKIAGIDFSLEVEDLLPLPSVCPVLGITLNYIVLGGKPRDNSPSIDRFDNSLGYVHGNVRVISNRANRLKSDGTQEEHLKIAEYMKGDNA